MNQPIGTRIGNLRLALKRVARGPHDSQCTAECPVCIAKMALQIEAENFDPEQIAQDIVLPGDIDVVRERVVRELRRAYERGVRDGGQSPGGGA